MTAKQYEDGTWGAGSGQHSHEVPVEIGRVVLIHDAHHDGTEVYRTESGEYRFVDLTSGKVTTCPRCVLLRLKCSADDVLGGFDAAGVDLDSPDGMALVGLEKRWLEKRGSAERLGEYGEVLWDSEAAI